MIQRFADDVAGIAAGIVDDLRATGPCDFVEHVAARLPLTIICQLMGIPDDSYAMVLHDTNVILSGNDPDIISENPDEAVGQILASGAELADLVTTLGQQRGEQARRRPHLRAGHGEHRWRAPHHGRACLVLHPVGRGR